MSYLTTSNRLLLSVERFCSMGRIGTIFILIVVTLATASSKQASCSKPSSFVATKGQSLSGHTISTHQVTSLLDCHAFCIHHARCSSYNYQYMSTSLTRMCEINDATGKMCPHDMIRATGFRYYEDRDKTCGKSCPPQGSDHSNFQLSFPTNTVSDFVRFDLLSCVPPLTAFTVCLWIKVGDKSSDGTLFSYSVPKKDNEILMIDYSSLKFYVNGRYRKIDRAVNNGYWRHICATWENTAGSWNFYIDGALVVNGGDFETGHVIKSNGIVILGQDQDNFGGGFHQHQSFKGEMYGVNMWNKVLSSLEILQLSKNCSNGVGNYLRWKDFATGLHGNVKNVTPTTCSP